MLKLSASLLVLIATAIAPAGFAADGKPVLVSVVGKDLKSTLGELGRENDSNIEVFDLKTGQAQIFKKADLQTISKDVTEASVIDRVGLSAFMAWRIKKVLPVSFATGKIAQIDGPVVYVSIGSKVGIEEGKELTVYRGATEIKDPDTGEVLGKQRKKVAKLEAIEVNEKLTKAKMIGDLETMLQVGDVVEPTVVSNSVAVLPLVNHKGHETIGTKRIAEELITGLVNREISVVERRLLDKVLGELNLQQGGGFDAAKAQKVGKQLGAYAIVIGSVTPKAKYAEAQLRLVRVETGEIMVAATQTFREVGDLLGASGDASSSGTGDGKQFFLDDLKEKGSSVGFGSLGKNGDLAYPNGGRVSYLGKEVEHALSMHPPPKGSSQVTYELDGSFRRFVAEAVINGTRTDRISESPLTFKVIGDGKLLWKSRPLQKQGDPDHCSVSIERVKQLRLEVACPQGNVFAFAVWMNPFITK
jgi:TolB-like protein